MNSDLHQIKAIIKRSSSPLSPTPTNIEHNLTLLPDIKAVLFDIYGTLFISASGDISLATGHSNEQAIHQALFHCKLQAPTPSTVLFPIFKELVAKHQESRTIEGIEFPEVDIRKVWQDFLQRLNIQHTQRTIENLATQYECLSNPVWPMPYLKETLDSLNQLKIPLGIISNAQFYTPLLFDALLDKSAKDLGFLPDLSFFSYKLLEAKPAKTAYSQAAKSLCKNYNIIPENVLYVGNDLLNDIMPAQKVGFKTALFAGDKRSLRLRPNHPLCKNIISDLTVTELPQIINCITPHA